MHRAPFLQIANVVKDFDGQRAVDHVSLDIAKGEVFALLGSSGCGKTTLLRMLAGFETPTSGTIKLDGADLVELPPYERPLNMMFQSYALFPHLSVWDNIAFGLRRARMPADALRERVEAMLKLVQLTTLARRKPHQLSGGQQQRVALARSLAKKPQLLLLDEPLGALDKKLREETRLELVRILSEVGVTCVMVTHDQEEAMTMSSRLAVMSEGRLLQVGAPGEIYEAPANRFVADFIGNVNLMDGTVIEHEPDHGVVESADCRHRIAHDVGAALGSSVTVALRPEKIRISRAMLGSEPPSESIDQGAAATFNDKGATAPLNEEYTGVPFNRVLGTVADIAYFGSYTLYRLTLPSGQTLKVSRSNEHRVLAETLRPGDPAWATWSSAAMVVLTA